MDQTQAGDGAEAQPRSDALEDHRLLVLQLDGRSAGAHAHVQDGAPVAVLAARRRLRSRPLVTMGNQAS